MDMSNRTPPVRPASDDAHLPSEHATLAQPRARGNIYPGSIPSTKEKPQISADVWVNEIQGLAGNEEVSLLNKATKRENDDLTKEIKSKYMPDVHVFSSPNDEKEVVGDIWGAVQRQKTKRTNDKKGQSGKVPPAPPKYFFISDNPKFSPALTLTFWNEEFGDWSWRCMLMPDIQGRMVTAELGLDASVWKGSSFKKCCKPSSGTKPKKYVMPFPGKDAKYGNYTVLKKSTKSPPGKSEFNWALPLADDIPFTMDGSRTLNDKTCKHQLRQQLWPFAKGYCNPFLEEETATPHLWPVPDIKRFDGGKFSPTPITELLTKNTFLLCFHASARKMSWQVVAMDENRVVTRGRAKPSNKALAGRVKYQVIIDKDDVSAEMTSPHKTPFKVQEKMKEIDAVLKILADKITKEGENTLDNIVGVLEKHAGYALRRASGKFRQNDKKEQAEAEEEKEEEEDGASLCTVSRGLDDGTATNLTVTLKTPAGACATAVLDRAGRLDAVLVQRLFGLPTWDFFLQDDRTGAFGTEGMVQAGRSYTVHTSPLVTAGQENPPHPMRLTVQQPPASDLTGSAQRAFDGYMRGDSELAKFLAQNWRTSSDKIKLLGRPVSVLHGAGLRTFADLRRLDSVAWSSLALPIALKNTLLDEIKRGHRE
mmetsp:Transcript_38822/g.97806  ORF Transcript_38822/g.97806 Transcript_38822/m.97806 type:complete len:650 (+) Transcript_38822:140-2089(+)